MEHLGVEKPAKFWDQYFCTEANFISPIFNIHRAPISSTCYLSQQWIREKDKACGRQECLA